MKIPKVLIACEESQRVCIAAPTIIEAEGEKENE